MNKHQGLVYWGPRAHWESLVLRSYSGNGPSDFHVSFSAQLHCSLPFYRWRNRKRSWEKYKGGGPSAQLPALTPSSTHILLCCEDEKSNLYFILNCAAYNSNSPMCGEWTREHAKASRELQAVVTELCNCLPGAGKGSSVGSTGGLLRCCPSQRASRWCAT